VETDKKAPEDKKVKDEFALKEAMTTSELISFAFEIGYTISIPIVILVLGGRLLDKNLETAPLFMIIGLLVSVLSTGYIIYNKTKKLM